MTPEEIEDLAFRNHGMPDGLNAAEQMLFQSFRKLYAYAKLVGMTPEEGKAEKAELLREFRKLNGKVEYVNAKSRFWIEIEAAGIDYAKNKSMETAENFYYKVYGLAKGAARVIGRKDEPKKP